MSANDQMFNWSQIQQDCIKVYAEISNTDQLGFIHQLCQDNRYQQLMKLEVQMTKTTLSVNENDASKIQKAISIAVQDVLR